MIRLLSIRMLLLLILATCAGRASADLPKVRNLRLNFTCEIGELPPGTKTVDVWIPIPPTNDRQTIKLLNEKELAGGRFTKEKTFGNQLYYRRFDVADAKTPMKVELVYDVEVHEATVAAAKELIATSAAVPAGEFAPYLRETTMIPIKGRITDLARTIKLPDGEPLQAGRAIYDHLVNTMVYNYLAPGAGKGNAVWACDSKTGDCTDFHSVFIGVCRWRGIPADHVFGLPLPPEKTEGDAKHCHCWAQFWVADVGWVPVDASRANKFPNDKDYYFGTLGSTWVTLAHGRDIVLEPRQQGEPLNMLHGPVAEVDGKPYEGLRWNVHYKDRQEADTK
jgi:transglutaminase-like putative cysteine protease